MYVGRHMQANLITVSPETSVLKAREIMDTHKIAHLPVTDGKDRLQGIVTDRDLKQAWASPASTLSVYELTYVLQKLNVKSIMKKDVVTATPGMTIERAARILHDQRIGALPVVKGEKLVGIITRADLMELLLSALGMSDDSGRLTLVVKDRIGVLADVGKAMQEAGINIRSIVTFPLRGYEGYWQLILRVNLNVHAQAVELLQNAGFKVLSDYVEDLNDYLHD